jgi:hypothetical protein
MQIPPNFDPAEQTSKVRQLEDLLRRVEKFQQSRLESPCNAERGEEALLDGAYRLETAHQEE